MYQLILNDFLNIIICWLILLLILNLLKFFSWYRLFLLISLIKTGRIFSIFEKIATDVRWFSTAMSALNAWDVGNESEQILFTKEYLE